MRPFEVVCQVLLRDPFHMTFEQIACLTDYQINEILLKHPGDDKAGGDEDLQSLTHEELFFKVWRRRGLTDEAIEERWCAEQEGDSWAGG